MLTPILRFCPPPLTDAAKESDGKKDVLYSRRLALPLVGPYEKTECMLGTTRSVLLILLNGLCRILCLWYVTYSSALLGQPVSCSAYSCSCTIHSHSISPSLAVKAVNLLSFPLIEGKCLGILLWNVTLSFLFLQRRLRHNAKHYVKQLTLCYFFVLSSVSFFAKFCYQCFYLPLSCMLFYKCGVLVDEKESCTLTEPAKLFCMRLAYCKGCNGCLEAASKQLEMTVRVSEKVKPLPSAANVCGCMPLRPMTGMHRRCPQAI